MLNLSNSIRPAGAIALIAVSTGCLFLGGGLMLDRSISVVGHILGAMVAIAGLWLAYLSVRLRIRRSSPRGLVVYAVKGQRSFSGRTNRAIVVESVGEVLPIRTYVPTIEVDDEGRIELGAYSHYAILWGERRAERTVARLNAWL